MEANPARPDHILVIHWLLMDTNMTKDEALRLALEALENLFGIPDKWTGEGGGDVAVWRLGGSYRAQEAISAIKAALEAKDEPVAWKCVCGANLYIDENGVPTSKVET